MINDALYTYPIGLGVTVKPSKGALNTIYNQTTGRDLQTPSSNNQTSSSTRTGSYSSPSSSSNSRSIGTGTNRSSVYKKYTLSDGTVISMTEKEYSTREGKFLSLQAQARYEGVKEPNLDEIMKGNYDSEKLALDRRIAQKYSEIERAKEEAAKTQEEQAKAIAMQRQAELEQERIRAEKDAKIQQEQQPQQQSETNTWWKWLLGCAGVIGLYFMFKPKKRK